MRCRCLLHLVPALFWAQCADAAAQSGSTGVAISNLRASDLGQHLRTQHREARQGKAFSGLGADIFRFLQKQQQPSGGTVVTAPPAAQPGVEPVPQGSSWLLYVAAVISTLFAAFLTAIVAFLYKERREAMMSKPGAYQNIEDFQHFNTGPFGIFDDLPLFVFTVQCPCIRWADTLGSVMSSEESRRPILPFWIGFFLLFLLYDLGYLTGEYSILFWVLTAGVATFFRYKLRKAFSMRNDTETCAKDCLLYTCCCCFAMAQEARHVEEARKLQHPAILK